MSVPILTIYNQHPAAGGTPPAVTNESADLYIGYFANRSGEQWIFTFNRATHEATLRGGDVGWGCAMAPEEAERPSTGVMSPPPPRGPRHAQRPAPAPPAPRDIPFMLATLSGWSESVA